MKKYMPWFAAALVVTVMFGTIYATVQQAQRQAANDPQIQLAEDAAAVINAGTRQVDASHINIATSLAPFLVIYDKTGRATSGTGYLNGTLPTAPLGMLQAASHKSYSTVTWQPANNVRIAAVTVATHSGYVVAGRSLSEVEKRETKTMQLTAVGWLATILILAVAL